GIPRPGISWGRGPLNAGKGGEPAWQGPSGRRSRRFVTVLGCRLHLGSVAMNSRVPSFYTSMTLTAPTTRNHYGTRPSGHDWLRPAAHDRWISSDRAQERRRSVPATTRTNTARIIGAM